ncbi:MAG: aliphatic sulfonate ABC transporter substrate-binding protein [Rhizomicrobium sp.]
MTVETYERPSRRAMLGGAAAGAALVLAGCSQDQGKPNGVVRIGYQKDGALVVAKTQKRLEARLGPLGVNKIEWAEFPSGPPLLEALNAGGIDFGATGDTPPIFAQAAGSDLVYVAAVPTTGHSSAILLPKGSPVASVAALKGKKIAFTRGSSAHYFAVRALQSAGLTLDDVSPAYLAPSDARAAFVRGSIDAWFIWDPYYAEAVRDADAIVLADAEPFVRSASFFLAGRTFTAAQGPVVRGILDELREVSGWIASNREAASELLSHVSGLELPILRVAIGRAEFGVVPVSPDIAARQQQVADDFARLGIIPKPIHVADAIANTGWR